LILIFAIGKLALSKMIPLSVAVCENPKRGKNKTASLNKEKCIFKRVVFIFCKR
jgi:hypothetical protein